MGYQTARVTQHIARRETLIIARSVEPYMPLACLAGVVRDTRILVHSNDFRVVHFA